MTIERHSKSTAKRASLLKRAKKRSSETKWLAAVKGLFLVEVIQKP
jgi:hypothetical protein